jgi:hypothetical protein
VIVLERRYNPGQTDGVMHAYHGQSWPTLELPWLSNQIGLSCVPEGRYHLDRDHTGRHRWFRLLDSELAPRSAIEIHPASRVEHLQGCIGMAREHCDRLAGMLPGGEQIWIRSETGPILMEV